MYGAQHWLNCARCCHCCPLHRPRIPNPQAASSIKSLLGLPHDSPACSVQFGHNSHELVTRLLSALVDQHSCGGSACTSSSAGVVTGAGAGEGGTAVRLLRVLASSCEFYSVTRQLNRLVGKHGGAP